MNEQSLQNTLLAALASGTKWSVCELALQCGADAGRVLAGLAELCAIGLSVERGSSNDGAAWVQLPLSFEPLESSRVVDAMSASAIGLSGVPKVLLQVGSTNQWLAERAREARQALAASKSEHIAEEAANSALCGDRVCMAEAQTAGRGRSGKFWHSPLGGSIYCSSLHLVGQDLRQIGGLSLVAGLAAIETLERFDLAGLRLKWPNDVMTERGKLAGILVELVELGRGQWGAIIGMGLNVHVPPAIRDKVSQPLTDLRGEFEQVDRPMPVIPRNRLAAAWLESIYQAVETFVANGLAHYQERFAEFDALRGCEVVAVMRRGDGNERIAGVASGIDERGRLLLRMGAEEVPIDAAEVSVRRTAGLSR